MKTEKGTLKKTKSGYMVTTATKKGSANFSIPEPACRFDQTVACDGLEVEVTRDDQNRIVKVTIPGKPEVAGPVTQSTHKSSHTTAKTARGKPTFSPTSGGGQPPAVRTLQKAPAKVLGMPFHNPYTFLPFGTRGPERRQPTAWSVDELSGQSQRLTGVLELEVTTVSPLLTCHPRPTADDRGHKTFTALRIGRDVIVPATGVRGALRTLLTIITSGTLGYLNTSAFLCQGRDANLGPAGPSSPPNTPGEPFLAEVVEAGDEFRDGKIRLGRTELVSLDDLEACWKRTHAGQGDLERGVRSKKKYWVGLDSGLCPVAISEDRSEQTPWRLKLSGRPIKRKGKREGVLLLEDSQELTLPARLWAEFNGRYAHADKNVLRAGDLVWLEPADPACKRLRKSEDVRSIQWSRWGRRGEALMKAVAKTAPEVLPDYLRADGLVDEVTDLFGQVAPTRDIAAPTFGARVRPENLVFFDAASQVMRKVTLAPLSQPHPGCIAFYRDNDSPDDVSETDGIRGYKVYRTTSERGANAPWLYSTQGVYDAQGRPLPPQQKMNKTCDLLPEGLKGSLRIAFRALTLRELALLMQACEVPWRLGGGKPLGLGACQVRVTQVLDEEGEAMPLPDWRSEVADLQQRVRIWIASQQPVPLLRYPRAADRNRQKINRGGHAWFQRHARPRKTEARGTDQREAGLEPLYIDGALRHAAESSGGELDARIPLISGQVLPVFDPDSPMNDVLYGFDGFNVRSEERERPNRVVISELEPFDPTNTNHVTGQERSSGSHGKDADFRRQNKRDRLE